ncbi:response regulator transcription factor [Microbacterium resistens]|uniref:Response regulator transcription factor n=1 Tax=Microbacterium resistens TaxID=156977 RepID=A0ABY3RNU9_9MICO|nr:response regulator transcription factor [Microbacterium resistens]MBW1639351.1 response regulator transcription factor [Microbacterium resistens]UGS25638.1 response regulator transcription factor [Microbacterium resistens]
MAETVRVLLVDDQELVRMGLRLGIDAEDDLTVVGEASNGDEAIELTASLAPDVVLMDVRMPGLDGIAATKHIVEASPDTRIIVLTTFDLDEYAFGALRAGASGFLLKDAGPAALCDAIRAVHAGDAAISPRVARRMLDLFADKMPADATPRPTIEALTPRETEILQAIGEGLNNAELSERFFLTESTVKTHVGRILMKLQLRDRVQAVLFAHRNGLV